MISSATAARRALALAAAGLVTLLTGCLKVDTELTIEGDTVSGTLLTALAVEAVAPLGITPEQIFADQDAGLGGLAGVTSEEYEQDGWAGTRYVLDQVAIEDLNAVSEGDPDGLRIVRDESAGTYEFQLAIDLQFMDELEQTDPTDPDAPDIDLDELREGFDVQVAVSFPGEVIEHNGELDGTTVRWQPPAGERSELRALAAGGDGPGGDGDQPGGPTLTGDGSGTGWWLVAVAAAAALGAGLAIAVMLGRRRNRQPGGNVE